MWVGMFLEIGLSLVIGSERYLGVRPLVMLLQVFL